MEKQRKCSLEEHKGNDAIMYCPECRIYMCNKCENFHSSLFKNHHPYKLSNEEDFFTGYCQEINHSIELKYFCKQHNKLCCAACLSKINKEGDGQHKDCDVCSLVDIKDEKKNKLKENIKFLEDLENKFNESIKELKELFQKIEKDKENLKLEVQKIFTSIRNAINEREDKLLLDIDNLFNDKFINNELIDKGEKLPKKIKSSLEKGKSINKEWDNNNLNSYLYDCINIENNIKIINEINENINRCKKNQKIKIKFVPKEESLNNYLETLKSFGKIYYYKYSFRECPNNINENRKYEITGEYNNIFTKTGPNTYAGTICTNELDKSIEEHKWKIKILKTTQNKYVMVGVAPIDFDINSSSYITCGWYYFCYLSTLYSGPPYNYSNKTSGLSKVNDEIIVVMNMKKRTLKFIINNEDKGDSYTDIPIDKPIFPAILLYYQNDSVEITEC